MDLKKVVCCLSLALPMFAFAADPTLFSDVFSSVNSQSPRDFSGVAIIAKGSDVIFSHQSGSVNGTQFTNVTKFTNDTQFLIGSLSKQITAALVLREVDQGRIDLDAPINKYLTQLPAEWGATVTVRHLLNHTSGIVAIDKPLKTVPGVSFAYSNLGYNLLGQLVAVTSAQSYSSLANALFSHCDMTNSIAVAKGSQQPASVVAGYHEKQLGVFTSVTKPFPYSAIPSGGIISTPFDLVQWNQCLHKRGIISSTSHQQMITKAATRKHRWGELGYGFALQLSQDPAPTEWSHSGYVLGYISTLAYYPESDISLVLLENTSWYPKDMSRVFYYHDQLRAVLLQSNSWGRGE